MNVAIVLLGLVILVIAASASIGYCLGYAHGIDQATSRDDDQQSNWPS